MPAAGARRLCLFAVGKTSCNAGPATAELALRAQQLLEHSLLTELRGVVARTLAGVDMFTHSQLADILGTQHNSHSHLPADSPLVMLLPQALQT